MMFLSIVLIPALLSGVYGKSSANPPCKWDSKTGAHFDLRSLTLAAGADKVYEIIDGDIPCTPETEPSFGYVWNFCSLVPSAKIPEPCQNQGKNGVVLQWAAYEDNNAYCYILARDDSNQITYSLLDPTDPTKGVSIAYPKGEKCKENSKELRSVVIDVQCANTPSVSAFAQEPSTCNYHLEMKSYYGCPTECPVTGNGLCDSHGHCAFDNVRKQAYCYCNEGYSGSSCNTKSSSSATTYDGFSVQLGLLITLLLVALGLTGGIVYLAWTIGEFRKHQVSSNYNALSGGESEMVETVNFR